MASLRANQLCLTKLEAFYNGVTVLVGKGRATDIIHIDLSKAFDTARHDILVTKLERHGVDGWNIQLIRNCLDGHTQKVVVNGLMSMWRPEMSGVPQGSVWGLVLFNTFVSNVDNGIECTNCQFPDNSKLCGVVDTPEGRDAIQRDLDRLERWAHENLMKFNKAKCKALHLVCGNPKHKCRLGIEWIERSCEKKDSGLLVDENLNTTWQSVLTAQKADCILGCI